MRRSTALLLVVVGVLILGVYVASFLLSTTSDRVDQLDNPPVMDAASRACTDLRVAVDALPPLPSGATRSERLARADAQGVLVDRLVQQVQQVGDAALDADVPARSWLADWKTLASSRKSWARDGTGPYAVPVRDGQPITRRMDAIGVDACTVPAGLVSPT